MRISDLVYYDWYYMWLMPFLVSILCVFTNRLLGREEDKCPTWQDKCKMIFIYCMCIFMNLFQFVFFHIHHQQLLLLILFVKSLYIFIWLLMLSNECWLMHHWGISK